MATLPQYPRSSITEAVLSKASDKLKEAVRSVFKRFGLRVSRMPTEENKKRNWLLHHKVELLFDLGANAGQYARAIREEGYKGKIVSFEPLPDVYESLMENSKADDAWIVHERCAVGSSIGEARINISQNSYSSSLLPMLATHRSAAPDSVYIGNAATKVITLDEIFGLYRNNEEKTAIKIDVQGYETEVLKGAKNSFSHIDAVQLELSIVPLYESQDLYMYYFDFFKKNGFLLWDLMAFFNDQKTGQLLQFDAVFVKKQTYSE